MPKVEDKIVTKSLPKNETAKVEQKVAAKDIPPPKTEPKPTVDKGDYSAKNLTLLEGLAAVRKRPGMYIGTTDVKGLHHLVWEIVDNSIDEVASGYANALAITINADGSVSIEDNGRGIPIDMHKSGMTGVELVFTQLHAGGKFDGSNYQFSAGLHGVGASVVNALSEWVSVEIYKNGNAYRIDFHSPLINDKKPPTPDNVQSGIVKTPLRKIGKAEKVGTKVTFMPDKNVFDTVNFDYFTIEERLRQYAFLNKNVKISLADLRAEKLEENSGANAEAKAVESEGRHEVFHYTDGLIDYVKYINEGIHGASEKSIIYLDGVKKISEKNEVKVKLAMQYVDRLKENLHSFVNGVRTGDGGTHETGFRTALTKCMNEYARQNNFFKKNEPPLLGDDFREGLTAVLAIQMNDPQFEGQTKSKLGNGEIRPIVENIVAEKLDVFLADKANKAIAEGILKRAMDAARTRNAMKVAAQVQRDKNAIGSNTLVGKFASCISKDPTQCELFIVEGDSAGGSAKQGRDRRTQAILPLKGKPLNVLKTSRRELIYRNEEIKTLIAAIGTDIGRGFSMDKLRFDKIIILSDADFDGFHIRSLLLSFFNSLMPELIVAGKIYVGMPPLYKIEKKGVVKYAFNDEELEAACAELKAGAGDVQRYKGLGEMSAEQLWETTLNPRTRMLTKVNIDDERETDDIIDTLLNDDTQKRKTYIFSHANFNKVDKFAKLL